MARNCPVTVIVVGPKEWLGQFLLGDLVNDARWPASSQPQPQLAGAPQQPRSASPPTGTANSPGARGGAAPGTQAPSPETSQPSLSCLPPQRHRKALFLWLTLLVHKEASS